jgi:hypothetical protein
MVAERLAAPIGSHLGWMSLFIILYGLVLRPLFGLIVPEEG